LSTGLARDSAVRPAPAGRRAARDRLHAARLRAARGPVLPVAAGAALVAVPVLGPSGAQFYILVMIALYGTMALGLTVIWGFCGQPSFGHAALFGAGAYAVAITTVSHHWNVWPALALAPVAGAAGGLVFALPAARVRTDQLALGTFALCEVFQVVELASGFTGGSNGLPGVAPLDIGGDLLVTPAQLYWPALGVLAIGYTATRLLRGSAAGRAMRSVRADELAARTLGARVVPLKVAAFAIGGALAGLAGGMYACFAGFISSVSFDVVTSFEVAIMVIIGGVSRPGGAIFGAAVVLVIQDLLQTHAAASQAITGVLMIIVIMIRAGAARRGLSRLRAAGRRRAAAGPARADEAGASC
jgi:branched-chain amino acid transport system permease protein